MNRVILSALYLIAATVFSLSAGAVERVPVKSIWDLSRVEHNATRLELSDMVRFKRHFYCSFREAQSHGNHPSGRGRVIRSADGNAWEPVALWGWDGADVREPKLAVTAESALMACSSIYFVSRQPRANGHYYQLDRTVGCPHDDAETGVVRQSVTWLSTDGTSWSSAYACPTGVNTWRWGATWNNGMGYSIGHPGIGGKDVRGTLYRTRDGKSWRPLLEEIYPADANGNEAALAFAPDGTACCLLRAGTKAGAMLGTASGPYYQQWKWTPPRVDWMGDGTLRAAEDAFRVSLGGPSLLRLSDGRLLGAGRMLGPGQDDGRIALFWVDPEAATLTRFAEVDGTSYAGVVEHDGRLWVSCARPDVSAICLGTMRIPGPHKLTEHPREHASSPCQSQDARHVDNGNRQSPTSSLPAVQPVSGTYSIMAVDPEKGVCGAVVASKYHLAATSDGCTLRLYVDVLDGRGYVERAATALPADGSTALGKGTDDAQRTIGRAGNGGRGWPRVLGWIDEVRVSDIARQPKDLLFVPRDERRAPKP